MTTEKKDQNIIRQNIPRDPANPVSHLPSGYSEGNEESPTDFYLPPCGIVDCDQAVKKLFLETLPFSEFTVNSANGPIKLKKPHTIFAIGEKYALVKKLRPIRDKNGVLLLPAISIRSSGLVQDYETMSNRGINQTTGELTIKRRISQEDTGYQQLINELMLENVDENGSSDRGVKNGKKQDVTLNPSFKNNLWEFLVIPQPQFILLNYEIVFWTIHQDHMNYMIETLISSQLPQVKGFKLKTSAGYWFIGTLEDSIENRDNSDDSTEDKRIIKKSFNLKVKAFLLPSQGDNKKVPIKRYISAASFSFDVYDKLTTDKKTLDSIKEKVDPFLLSDVEEIPVADKQNDFYVDKIVLSQDTINSNGTVVKEHIRVTNATPKEKVYRATSQQIMQEFFFPKKR